jgi:prevent-host-death family protein
MNLRVMPVNDVSISYLKANLEKFLKRAKKNKLPVRITRRGKPIAEILVTEPTACVDRAKWIGSMRDSIKILGDIVSPTIDPDEWERLRD